MYSYIYDDWLNRGRSETRLNKIETRVAELGIKGTVHRLMKMSSARDVVARSITRGATTIVAVGGDAILLKVVRALNQYKGAIGYIPMSSGSMFAKKLNLEKGDEHALQSLAARRIRTAAVGKINTGIFLDMVNISGNQFTAILNESFTLQSQYRITNFTITNPTLKSDPRAHTKRVFLCSISPVTQYLPFLPKKHGKEKSRFYLKKMSIKSQTPLTVTIDGIETSEETHVTLALSLKKINFIVGRSEVTPAKKV